MHPDVIWGTCDQCGEGTKRIHKDTKVCGECVDNERAAARESELMESAAKAEAQGADLRALLMDVPMEIVDHGDEGAVLRSGLPSRWVEWFNRRSAAIAALGGK